MPRNRAANRETRKAKKRQEQLPRRNAFGMLDLTPANVLRVMTGREIRYK